VGDAIGTHALWEAGDRVAVAVSGGLDSVVLLDLLHHTAAWHEGRLSVVTLDHGTRPSATADAERVVELADRYGLVCTRLALGLGPTASEAQCRTARYAALDGLDVDRVALGHHQRDQAETVLLQLLRGAGARGLRAMRWRRGRYVRPLLDTPHADLEAWAAHRGLEWQEDPTNHEPRFTRNRVRAELLPLLESIRPGAVRSLARSARVSAAEDEWLTALVDQDPVARRTDRWPRAWVANQPLALVGRALRRARPDATTSQVDAVRAAAARGGGRVAMGNDAAWIIDEDHVWLDET